MSMMVCVPAFAAESKSDDAYQFSIEANSKQLETINAIKGTDMTVYEFYKTVYPEIASRFSSSQKANYNSVKYPWKDVLKNDNGTVTTNGVGGSKSYLLQYTDHSLESTSETEYVSSDTPVMITIDSYILNSDSKVVASGSNVEFDSKSCSANATLDDPTVGAKYRAEGVHVITNEDGVYPPIITQTTYSYWYTAK